LFEGYSAAFELLTEGSVGLDVGVGFGVDDLWEL
jgi:hypothetical protein